jgi:hypothetical protein
MQRDHKHSQADESLTHGILRSSTTMCDQTSQLG